jgi:Tfp pilus assembly protein PilN
MGQFDLNLSTRPFPAYQLKTILLMVAAILLAALSAWQVIGFMRFTSLSNQIRGEAREGQIEAEVLSRRVADLDAKLSRPEQMAKLTEIEFFNSIIARKSMSWTRLFATLEEITPETVHLTGLRPDFTDAGEIILHFEVRVRSIPDTAAFIEALQGNPAFTDVILTTQDVKSSGQPGMAAATPGIDVSLTARYHPQREEQ